ncbi:TorF family putative porin [Flavobacterium sp.]|uniref:TorF family putative porin n=1 Tax=Flavobacterium sp. TaxID=239 RepID=UPI003D0E5E2B
MNHKLFLALFFLTSLCQSQTPTDSTKSNTKKWNLTLEVMSRYVWRGQCWGGNYVAVQPTLEYSVNSKLKIGTWATHNFQSEYAYPDGTVYKGYQEIDLFIKYQWKKYLRFELWDYYWPTISNVEGIDNSYFNYRVNGTKTVDFTTVLDLSEVWLPFNATLSTLVAGNDFRLDENGENPKQNFTTYGEIGYSFINAFKKISPKTLKNIDLYANAGMVFNNQAQYYSFADYDKPSLVNLSLKAERVFQLNDKWSLPIYLNYIHNGATKNTEAFGKNFWVFGAKLKY